MEAATREPAGRSVRSQVTFPLEDSVNRLERSEVPAGIEVSAQRSHAQVGDAGRLARAQDTEPLAFAAAGNPELAS